MKGSVSSRRLSVFRSVLPLVAALSVVWVAFFILMPNAFPPRPGLASVIKRISDRLRLFSEERTGGAFSGTVALLRYRYLATSSSHPIRSDDPARICCLHRHVRSRAGRRTFWRLKRAALQLLVLMRALDAVPPDRAFARKRHKFF